MLTIRQADEGWIIERDGTALTVDGAAVFATYELAVSVLANLLGQLAAMPMPDMEDGTEMMSADGLLPESWMSPADGGICFSAPTGDGRDFTGCEWSWRDPATAFVPLMLQTSTEFGHFGAELAGFAEEISDNAGTPGARGRFFDSETGRQFRDMMLGGRRFTVSVDPGAVTYEDECLEVDDDGWCSRWQTNFLTYRIIGITGTPFAGFEEAAIMLDPATVPAEPVTASAGHADCGCPDPAACSCSRPAPDLSTRSGPVVVHATREQVDQIRFTEDRSGVIVPGTIADGLASGINSRSATVASAAVRTPAVPARHAPVIAAGSAPASSETVGDVTIPYRPPVRFFDDPAFEMPTPLTITREGRVLSHVALAGSCHTGHLDRCVTPPLGGDYRDFIPGSNGVTTAEGDRIPTGALTWGIPHADLSLDLLQAQAHYADSRHGWADVAAGEDRFGIWVAGVLRPGLTEADIRILRSLALSGDWRYSWRVRGLSMCAALAVNHPAFPITAAAGGRQIASPLPRDRIVNGVPMALVASGMVMPGTTGSVDQRIDRRLAQVERVLAEPARAQLRQIHRDVEIDRLRG